MCKSICDLWRTVLATPSLGIAQFGKPRKMIGKTILILSLCVFSSRGEAFDDTDLELVQSTVGTWIQCSLKSEPSRCLEERTIRQVREMATEMGNDLEGELKAASRTGKVLSDDEDANELRVLESENSKMLKTIEENKSESPGLIDEISDFFTSGFLKFFDNVFGIKKEETSASEQKNTGKNSVEARGHKKKYLKKQNKHLKIILILMLIKNKIKMFLHKFQFLIQLKFLAIAVANLLINLVRLWLELKKKHKPNKVIYYEKSHHQHHYDNEHVHDEPDDHHYSYPSSYKHYAHHDEEESGGGIWPWSRNWVENQRDIWANPPYRHPGSHNLVYMNQRPIR